MPNVTRNAVDKIKLFRTAWSDGAPEVSFAGMTFAQFEEATRPATDLQSEIELLEMETRRKKSNRDEVNQSALEMMELVVNSVRGTPGFGATSALYRNLGYIRKQDRSTGKTNKSPKPTVAATAK